MGAGPVVSGPGRRSAPTATPGDGATAEETQMEQPEGDPPDPAQVDGRDPSGEAADTTTLTETRDVRIPPRRVARARRRGARPCGGGRTRSGRTLRRRVLGGVPVVAGSIAAAAPREDAAEGAAHRWMALAGRLAGGCAARRGHRWRDRRRVEQLGDGHLGQGDRRGPCVAQRHEQHRDRHRQGPSCRGLDRRDLGTVGARAARTRGPG